MPSSPQPQSQPQVNPWIVATAVMCATFMEVLDTTVVNVSLPHIAGSLSVSVDEAAWALTSYLVANAIILPMTGWLANFFGRKRMLTAAVFGFTAASFLCGLAQTLPMLILCRVIQGATGGALQPLSQAVMLEAFPPQDRGKAMAFWGLGIVVAPMLGPVIGGYLTDNFSWRWVFYINLPVGLASVIMTRLFIFDPPYIRRQKTGIDYWGIGMLALGIGALQLLLDKGQEEDWFGSKFIAILAVLAGAALIAFVVRELRAQAPVVQLRVFKDRTYAAGVFLMTMLGFVLYGSLLLLPIFLQTLLGYSALDAGIAMAPRGLGSFLTMPLVGTVLGRFDPRKVLAVGLVGAAWTLYSLSNLNLNAGYWDIFWPQFIQGASLAMLFVPLTTATMDPIPKEEMGNATSMFNLMRNLGGGVGIASATTFLFRRTQFHSHMLGEHISALSPQTRTYLNNVQAAMVARGSDPSAAVRQSYIAAWGMVQRQASMLAFLDTFRAMAVVFLLVLPFLLIMKRPSHRRSAGGVH
ncbi:MAG TPA: DHA2 family efflux MFS transporter permease subunit [Candidatus Acidoferrales bacterium]|jgi:DHA2 family multidrug resistance protein|nr:DHA2 family efflux MFS transporter permease subunit [Candidatus Acidoferrales bacterium]